MRVYRIHKLFFPTLFASVSALSGTFKDLNPDYLVKYFNSNIQVKCPLAAVQILDVFKNPNISQTQSDCFVLDKSNASDIKYVMKPVGGCSPEALHPKLLSNATAMCPSTTATAAANGTKTGAAAGSGITAQDIAQTVIGGAAVAQQYQRNVANQRKEDAKVAKAAPAESSAPKDKPATEGSTPVVPGTTTSAAINTAIASAKPAAPAPQAASAPAATPAASTNEGTTGTVDTEFGNLDAAQAAAKIRDPSIGKALSPEEDARVSQQMNEELSGTPPLEPAAAAEAAKNLSNTPLAESAVGAASTAGASAVDSAATTAKQTAEQTNEAFIAKLRAELTAGIATGEARMAACMPIGVTCPPPTDAASMSKAVMIFQEVQATLAKYTGSQSTCSTSATTAENLCSMIRSPKAIMVQQLMSIATPLISKMSSASQTCGSTADISKIAQTGMTLANMACTGVKVVCDNSCKTTTTLLQEMKGKISSVSASLPKESGIITSAIATHEKSSILPKVAQCEKHSADIVQMATQAMGLLLAAQQAKECKEKLTAGGGNGNGSGNVSMDELCKDPAQAQTLVCKCKADATAAGCPGAVVKGTSGKDNGSLVIKGGGSGSQLAGIDAFRQGSGLSSAAKTALGLDSDSAASTAAGALGSSGADAGVAAAGSSQASDARGSMSASAADEKHKAEAKEKKFNFGSFGSLGNAIGGFFGGSGSKKSGAGTNFASEKQIAAAKRQIANEQLRSEISTASGRSNWDKVRTRYVESNSTFLGN